MSYTQQLAEYQKYGETVLLTLETLPPADPTLAPLRKTITTLANSVVRKARSPVKIGVVGEFSSGKTLLLGALIGYGDALPVSATPSTGNVTALRFIPEEGITSTRPRKFRVEYLDEPELQDCLAYLLEELKTRSRAAVLKPSLVETLAVLDATDPHIWERITPWCKDAWHASDNPGLRLLIRETLAFVRARNACSAALAGRVYEIDPDTAAEGLLLAVPQDDLQRMSFDRLGAGPQPLSRSPDRPTPALLRETFALIRRVEVEVPLPRAVWDLSELRGSNEFVLLDFPGLGAANSGVRDRYLCLRELDDVQTILILVSSDKPGGREALDIYDMMQKRRGSQVHDCVLVGMSRFDQLPLGANGEETLRQLSGEPDDPAMAALPGLMNESESSEPLDEKQVCAALRPLQEVVARSRELTSHPDRIVILSAMLGLAHLQNRCPDLKVGSPAFLNELASQSGEARRLLTKWQTIGDRLRDPSGKQLGLGNWLADYCDDGGRRRLQELLARHVGTHGLRLLYTDVKKEADELARHVNQLCQLTQPGDSTSLPPTDLNRLRTAIQQVVRVYQGMIAELDIHQPDLHIDAAGLTEVCRTLHGDASQALGLLGPGNTPPRVADVIREEVIQTVMSWPQWRAMLLQIDHGRLPSASQRQAGMAALPGLEMEEVVDEGDGVPNRSDDFFAPFSSSLEHLEKFSRLCVQQSIPRLVDVLERRLAEVREELRPLWQTPGREQQLRATNKQAAVALVQLRYAVELQGMIGGLVKEFSEKEAHGTTLKPASLFPLPRADAKHTTGRIFPWATQHARAIEAGGHHQVLLLRLRDTLASSANQAVMQLVSDLNRTVVQRLRSVFQTLGQTLTTLTGNSQTLAALAATTTPGSEPPPATNTYAALASIRPPL